MQNLKKFVDQYRLPLVSLASFLLGAFCVAAMAVPSFQVWPKAQSLAGKLSRQVLSHQSQRLAKKAIAADAEMEAENKDESESEAAPSKEAASEVVAAAVEKNGDEESESAAETSTGNGSASADNSAGSAAGGIAASSSASDSLIPNFGFSSEEGSVATASSVRAVPFWENLEADEIFANLNLSEILHIDAEVSPQIGNAMSDRVLSDFQGRISPDFEVPELIFNQTKFWFRVYTEFDSNKKIIHDSLHPHIIFDIVDVSDVLAQPTRAQWLNVVKAQKMVAKRMNEIRWQLKKMARKKKEDMSTQELSWLSQFEAIRGNPRKVILTSAESLRVQTGQKDFFENALSTSGRYLDGMESIFKRKGLPIELTRLPFVESSFVIGATSKVGAAGIWQFMPGVGRQFMRVNDQVDERRSPWKATEAAAKLLKENYTILYKKWGLALTAYNHGPGGVRKAMQRTGSKDIARIVRSYRSKSFDFASANFYTCFLAAVHAQMYRDLLWPDRKSDEPLAYDSILLKKDYRPRQLLTMTGLTGDQILLYNPELDRSFRRNYVIPKGYRLFLPSDVKVSLQQKVIASRPETTSTAAD